MTTFTEVLSSYRQWVEAMEKKGSLKHKTAYDYLSRLGALETYIRDCHIAIRYVYQFDRSFVMDYLDYLVLDKDVSATTRNNHRTWLSTFSTCIDRKKISLQ